MTDARESVESALEQSPVQSHLHPVSSFDLDDHPVPTGREEIWRFTPLKRLAGALDDAPSDECAATYETSGPAEFFVGTLAPGQAPRGKALVPDGFFQIEAKDSENLLVWAKAASHGVPATGA